MINYDDVENVEPRVLVGIASNDDNGKWVVLSNISDEKEFITVCEKLYPNEKKPKFEFQEHEGFPDEFCDLNDLDYRLWDWLRLNDFGKKVYAAYMRVIGNDVEVQEAIGKLVGEYGSEAEYAKQDSESVHGIDDLPYYITCHIDWDGVARDLFQNNYLEFDDDSGMVFDPNK